MIDTCGTSFMIYEFKYLKSFSKFLYITSLTLSNVFYKGFCSKDTEEDEENQSENEGEEQVVEGTGIGEGSGKENVSKEIEFEEQVLGHKDEIEEENQEDLNNPENKNKKEDGIEMEQDFDGQNVDQNQEELDDEQKDKADQEGNEEFSDVDDELDFKFWNGDDEKDDKNQDNEEEDKENKDQKDDKDEIRNKEDMDFVADNLDEKQEQQQQAKEKQKEKDKTRHIDEKNVQDFDDKDLEEQEINEQDENDVMDEEDDGFEPQYEKDKDGQNQEEQKQDEKNEADNFEMNFDAEIEEDENQMDEENIDEEGEEVKDALDEEDNFEKQQDENQEENQNEDEKMDEVKAENNMDKDIENEIQPEKEEITEMFSKKNEENNQNQFGTKGTTDQLQAGEDNGKENQEEQKQQQQQEQQNNQSNEQFQNKNNQENILSESFRQEFFNSVKPLLTKEKLKEFQENLNVAQEQDKNQLDQTDNEKYQNHMDLEYEIMQNQNQEDNLATNVNANQNPDENVQAKQYDKDELAQENAGEGEEKEQEKQKEKLEVENQQKQTQQKKQQQQSASEKDQNKDKQDSEELIEKIEQPKEQAENEVQYGRNQKQPNIENQMIDEKDEQVQLNYENLKEIIDGLTQSKTSDERKQDILRMLKQWKENPENIENGLQLWRRIEVEAQYYSLHLSEELKSVLEPTEIASFKGDYKSGKRLNMKKIIPYIASNFRKDKIWLRRSDPSKRQYQIFMAIDNSLSMKEKDVGFLALKSLMILSLALTKMEIGEIAIAAIDDGMRLLQDFESSFDQSTGPYILSQFGFDFQQTMSSDIALPKFLRSLIDIFKEKDQGQSKGEQICFIISDGRFNKKMVRPLVAEAEENNQLLIFIILDNKTEKDSIYNIKSTEQKYDENGKLKIQFKKYLEDFPFPYYIIINDANDLSTVLVEILRQYFDLKMGI